MFKRTFWAGCPRLAAPLFAIALSLPGFAGPASAQGVTASTLTELGLESASADSASAPPRYGYENRRYRHPMDALGEIERVTKGPFVGIERRLGLATASIGVEPRNIPTTFRVGYPSDRDFVSPPASRVANPTSHAVYFLVRPLISYELGHINLPVQFRIQAEPLVRYNPWPGARLTGSIVLPLYNDFDFDALHPDVDEVRPGLATLEQFAWIRNVALVSATGGLFGDNRYGGSLGAARPILGGRLLADAQVDLSGFIAFEPQGIGASNLNHWSSFGGLTWFIPGQDAALRVRYAQFLYGDHGLHTEFRRSFGDFDYALFLINSNQFRVEGIRVTLPVPPMTRFTRGHVRPLPIERYPISYRTDATPVGNFLGGVASREAYLDQLSPAALKANRFRYERRVNGKPEPGPPRPIDWMNASGVSGFIFTPQAGVLRNRTVSVDYTQVPKAWAYDHRGESVNEAYSLTIGLLPRIEASLRFTRLPGVQGGLGDIDNIITTDTDHMASGRLALLIPKGWRPGLAIGGEDIGGTRRFNSSYLVSGLDKEIKNVQTRFSVGYAPHVFRAPRHVLDGGFGAVEFSPWRVVAARMEYDSEKWNVGIGAALPYGLRFRAAALNLETLSVGAGWTHEL